MKQFVQPRFWQGSAGVLAGFSRRFSARITLKISDNVTKSLYISLSIFKKNCAKNRILTGRVPLRSKFTKKLFSTKKSKKCFFLNVPRIFFFWIFFPLFWAFWNVQKIITNEKKWNKKKWLDIPSIILLSLYKLSHNN